MVEIGGKFILLLFLRRRRWDCSSCLLNFGLCFLCKYFVIRLVLWCIVLVLEVAVRLLSYFIRGKLVEK